MEDKDTARKNAPIHVWLNATLSNLLDNVTKQVELEIETARCVTSARRCISRLEGAIYLARVLHNNEIVKGIDISKFAVAANNLHMQVDEAERNWYYRGGN